MKSLHNTLTLVAFTVLLFAAAANAQIASRFIRVDVPFEFQVGKTVLPPGDYTIARANSNILILRDSQERVVASMVTTQAQVLSAPHVPKLVFYTNGGRNVLARIWTADSRYGYELSVARNRSAYAKARITEVQAATGR
ncbi:MAG TPA: hypothetical protein VGJ21_16470 [Terracidiphilus sp.]